jgi:hypothetical protein
MVGLKVGYSPYTVVRSMEGDPPLVSSCVPEGGSHSPALISKGAIEHVSRQMTTMGSTVFTPRRLLELAAPHGSEDAKEAPINVAMTERCLTGLEPPSLDSTGGHVTGADTPQHRIENMCRWKALLATHVPRMQWTKSQGECDLPHPLNPLASHQGEMYPSSLAPHYPAAELLKEWATYECPTCTGKPWTQVEIQEVVDRGPHQSALTDKAITHFKEEVKDKVRIGQAIFVAWDSIKDNLPQELQISPIAANPPTSKQFCSILDLSFHSRLQQGVFCHQSV